MAIHGHERALLRVLFDAAVAAADPALLVPRYMPPLQPKGRTIVLGAGKASAAMARALEDHRPASVSGLVVTRYGHAVPCQRIEIVEAGHPLPDRAGAEAAARMLALAQGAGPDDLVLALFSGGGSALLPLPAPGLTLADLTAVNHALLRSGATISEINAVRKHLSAIAGGRLAVAAYPAPVTALIISDVPGDDPATVASGPTLADPTTFADARAVIARHRIPVPPSVAGHLKVATDETPKRRDPRLALSQATIIASAAQSLAAAADAAKAAGLAVLMLGDALEGEARDLGRAMGEAARDLHRKQHAPRPTVLLSGGETTVTVRGNGKGGRNAEFQAGLALALAGEPGIFALAADTDGIDGTGDNAGAIVTPDTLARANAAGLDLAAALAANDTYAVFQALGDLVVTGPTRTNVNDFRAILIV